MARRKGAPKDGERLLGDHVAKKTSRVPVHVEARPPPLMADDELLDIDEVCAFFGGIRPLHPATIYRGLGVRYPHPVKVGPNSNRSLKSECQAALAAMAAERVA
jgi:predicted DNA-binding transcriptional regulator AlpA